ncbi:MAG: N-acetylmuramic acid 6-phosphate etherase [Vulcanimicrobiaceae bacterium]
MTYVPPQTESANPRTTTLDTLATRDLVALLASEQRSAAVAVELQSEVLAGIVDAVAHRLRAGGRLHYVGAGTSGRLGVLDASEMPPTFGTQAGFLCAHIAGGDPALRTAVEGAEDDREAGVATMRGHVDARDAVIALSASGGAPYAIGAIDGARAAGALTVAFVNAEGTPLAAAAERVVVLSTGPEPIAGSTRMIAGTAQKIALNTLSTAIMVRLGKVHGNLMIDVVASNRKLRERALGLVQTLGGVDRARAQQLLDAAGGRVKAAVVMAVRAIDLQAAQELLDAHGGILREVL